MSKYLLGYDVGSSSIKASVIDSESGSAIGSATSPDKELAMISKESGWAEQHPDTWWKHVIKSTHQLIKKHKIDTSKIAGIGISYQMHGLVVVDKNHNVLRPSIIWCDSRAAEIGNEAFNDIGSAYCLSHYLNSPGNFTASKLKWVKDHEPGVYEKIHKIMLPGDFIGMKMTGNICTTVSGLSEGILWNFKDGTLADKLLEYYGISEELIPETLSSFEVHGELTPDAAAELGLQKGIKVAYRAGDQPNNAFSLNVLNPGDVAATAGTSGVVYGITDSPEYDDKSRVNTFVHVNHSDQTDRYGVLLCINGTGILNSWLKHNLGIDETLSYEQINQLASQIPIGSDGINILPFGNGAERILENKNLGSSFHGISFNRHKTAHLFRSAQEGIAFSMKYGFQIMEDMGLKMDTVRAGHANMFLSPLFREAFVNLTGSKLELYNTDGAQGAARGAGVGIGLYSEFNEAFEGLKIIDTLEPDTGKSSQYLEAYELWLDKLEYELQTI